MAHVHVCNPRVALPPGLTVWAIRKAISIIERELGDLLPLYRQHLNVFSPRIVGIFGSKALGSFSNYERHKHKDTAQQRFPDLCRRGCRIADPRYCLESKGSKRPWEIQAHYDHAGWYIVWRYLVDATGSLEAGRPVIIWRVDVVYLEKTDWKYEKSGAGELGGGRTHTFGVRKAAQRLKGKAVYQRQDVIMRGRKPVVRNGD